MSCCPSAPPIKIGSGFPDEPSVGNPAPRAPGEPEDCYQKRVGGESSTGLVDDKPNPANDKIQQNTIAPNATSTSCSVNLTFTVSGPRVPSSWAFERTVGGAVVSAFTGETGTAPDFRVVFDAADYGKKMTLRVRAIDGDGIIDDRTYAFSPALASTTNSLKLVHPLPGAVITSKFGPRSPPVNGASSEHGGVDFASRKPGSKVLCGADGTVSAVLTQRDKQTGAVTGYGQYLIVKHTNGSGKHLISTLYAHLDKFLVGVGDSVLAGQPIGIEGNTGRGSGPHLHFEVRLPNGTRVEPMPYISGDIKVAESNSPVTVVEPAESRHQGTVTPEDVAARSDC